MKHMRLWLRGLGLLMMLVSGWALFPRDLHAAPADHPGPRAGRHALIIGVGRYVADPAPPDGPRTFVRLRVQRLP